MDAESLKAAISALSALIAVVSAVWAYRSRVQTRRDIYEGARDALMLAMAENDAQREVLEIRVAHARAEISRVHPDKTTEESGAEGEDFLEVLKTLEKVADPLQQRAYTLDSLDHLEYSEKNLSAMRRLARGEQLIAKKLMPAAYDVTFNAIASFVKRHEWGLTTRSS